MWDKASFLLLLFYSSVFLAKSTEAAQFPHVARYLNSTLPATDSTSTSASLSSTALESPSTKGSSSVPTSSRDSSSSSVSTVFSARSSSVTSTAPLTYPSSLFSALAEATSGTSSQDVLSSATEVAILIVPESSTSSTSSSPTIPQTSGLFSTFASTSVPTVQALTIGVPASDLSAIASFAQSLLHDSSILGGSKAVSSSTSSSSLSTVPDTTIPTALRTSHIPASTAQGLIPSTSIIVLASPSSTLLSSSPISTFLPLSSTSAVLSPKSTSSVLSSLSSLIMVSAPSSSPSSPPGASTMVQLSAASPTTKIFSGISNAPTTAVTSVWTIISFAMPTASANTNPSGEFNFSTPTPLSCTTCSFSVSVSSYGSASKSGFSSSTLDITLILTGLDTSFPTIVPSTFTPKVLDTAFSSILSISTSQIHTLPIATSRSSSGVASSIISSGSSIATSASSSISSAISSSTISPPSPSAAASSNTTLAITTTPLTLSFTSTSSASASSSTTAAAAAPASGAPSKPAIAGIAVGGGTCVLLAIFAAVYLLRRRHTRAVAQRSGESVYPELAYLYDPPIPQRIGTNGPRRGGGGSGSGGAGAGITYTAVPNNTPNLRPSSPSSTPPPLHPRLAGYGGPVADASGALAARNRDSYGVQSPFEDEDSHNSEDDTLLGADSTPHHRSLTSTVTTDPPQLPQLRYQPDSEEAFPFLPLPKTAGLMSPMRGIWEEVDLEAGMGMMGQGWRGTGPGGGVPVGAGQSLLFSGVGAGGSPASGVTRSVVEKNSSEMLFADPRLIGREF
ncbi:hypothetical protein K432DRAFT_380526 [Lepidopterella palustris CBS 459.81]|uniref:Mid2 domain-containing protein n=1 Tax=Lepidopterella palustris CBS 459.81 TaxID=1314670 RepID=A0A8E2EEC9_9PEZI|nr:hypothetical protein K432DRAFT_380526 [Lepidopterella palustris CBS 459.81]